MYSTVCTQRPLLINVYIPNIFFELLLYVYHMSIKMHVSDMPFKFGCVQCQKSVLRYQMFASSNINNVHQWDI